ncbi:hypothetical protein BKA69DRAFT_1078359 [Paraphysoderma sedebokerense]|nr:hypothetical protein BKA69DRAFT_1078359 [Paraphysoderma sedebokerense]
MGSLLCLPVRGQRVETDGNAVGDITLSGNKQFSRKGATWSSEKPMTEDEWKSKKETFWDTAPSYEGKLEIWQALKSACEADDINLAQCILDAAQISLPTGDLTQGCYDILGNRYVLPNYVIIAPTNLIKSNLLAKSTGSAETINDTPKIQGTPVDIICRLSTNADVAITIGSDETIALLKKRLTQNQNWSSENVSTRMLLLGRVLEDKVKIAELKFGESRIIQVMVSFRG